MNKAVDLYTLFFAEVQYPKTSKKCVLIFVDELEKLIPKFKEHEQAKMVFTLQQIREDLEEL